MSLFQCSVGKLKFGLATDLQEFLQRKYPEHAHAFQKIKRVTISLGVTTFQGEQDSGTAFSKRADQALYLAKDSGRNNAQVM